MQPLEKSRLVDIDAATVSDWLREGKAVLVDVREPEEYAEERIPGAILRPLSQFVPHDLPQEPGKMTVLACLIGGRSARAAEHLFAAGYAQAYHLEGGLIAWKEAGFDTVC